MMKLLHFFKKNKKYLLFFLSPLFALLGYLMAPLFMDDAASLPVAHGQVKSNSGKKTSKAGAKKGGNPRAEAQPEVIATGSSAREKVDLDKLVEGAVSPEETERIEESLVDLDQPDESQDEEPLDDSLEQTQKRLELYNKSLQSSRDSFSELDYTGNISISNWRNPAILQKQLVTRIRSRLKDLEPETVSEFLTNPENRLMIAQYELLNRSEMEDFAKVMENPDFGHDLEPLLNSLPWIAGFIYDGEVHKMDVAMQILQHLREVDPNMDKLELSEEKGEMIYDAHIKRRIAGAIAAEFSNNNWYGAEGLDLSSKELNDLRLQGVNIPKKPDKKSIRTDLYKLARERYFFFAEGIDKRLFNSDFYTMPDWLLRFPCGWQVGNFGTKRTLEWQRDNNCAPAESYLDMADHVQYVPINSFGDVLSSPHYYQPTEELFPDNRNKQIRDMGTELNGQSNYAASAAAANGIPSMLIMEPNRCSYAIYSEGKWKVGNSVSPIRHPVWKFWDNSTWGSLLLYTEMFQDAKRTRDAQMITTLADIYTESQTPVQGLELYELAIAMQPLNRYAWDSYVETATKNLYENPRRWLAVNDFLCRSMAPSNPSACAALLRQRIYPSMLKVLRTPRQKLEAYHTFLTHLKDQEDTPWDMDGLLAYQHEPLGPTQTQQLNHYLIIIKAVCDNPKFASALTWAIRDAYKQNHNLGDRLMGLVNKYRATCKQVALIDAAIIRAAEEIGNVKLFHYYSRAYMAGLGDLPYFEKPKGNLISAGALVRLDSYADNPQLSLYHASALTEKGGLLSSRGGAKECLTIELDKLHRLGSIIIIPTCGNASPYYLWTISISKDGKSWEELAALPEKSEKPLVCLTINKQHPSAKFIRIDSGESLHYGIQFRAVLIYDNKNQSK